MRITAITFFLALNTIFLFSTGCKKNNNNFQPAGMIDHELGIEKVPDILGKKYQRNFNRYTRVVAPNGGSIHIVAQNNITNEQMIRCRSILDHYLTNFEGSVYGIDKDEIANKMADNNAILLLLNGQDDGSNKLILSGQALYENEIQVEGSSWYITQDYEHRDAAYEEILHLVHDYGIGVDGNNEFIGASPNFQSEIRAAQENALNNNLWGINSSDWIKELTKENSLSQEYLASLIDSYYGLWGAWTESSTHGMWGIYVAKTREEIQTEDHMGYQILEDKFFHPYLTYNARIDSSFTGTFCLKYDEYIPYTNHSQYLKDISLLGSNNTNVVINQLDNIIVGNNGTNTIIFSGNVGEYSIVISGDTTTVTDNTQNRDGTNIFISIEKLQFIDETINL